MTLTFIITPPPSANKLWGFNRGRVHKTNAYTKWRDGDAGKDIMAQRKGQMIVGPTIVSISLRRPNGNSDLDNRIKPILDALQAGSAIVNDKQVTCVTASWADHDGCRVTVSPDMGAA